MKIAFVSNSTAFVARGGIACLQIGESAAIGDDILHGLDVRIIRCRIIDIAENTVCNREPDFGGRIACSAETVLP